MPRRILALAALSATVVLSVWGCQDDNFNPVGSCIIQPGSRQVRLEDVSVADVLFVVDDSGSMAGEQQNLARNFGAFIFTLAQENRSRVASRIGWGPPGSTGYDALPMSVSSGTGPSDPEGYRR